MLTSRRMQMSFSHELSNTSLEKDTEEKRRAYAAAGIADYWVANLRQGELIVYRQPLGGDYQSVQGLQQGQVSPLAFPDMAVEVKALL